MDVARMKQQFERQLKAGLWCYAVLPSGRSAVCARTSIRADFAAASYGVGGYSCSILLAARDDMPDRDGVVRLEGKSFVVVGRTDFGGISVRLDLREGV